MFGVGRTSPLENVQFEIPLIDKLTISNPISSSLTETRNEQVSGTPKEGEKTGQDTTTSYITPEYLDLYKIAEQLKNRPPVSTEAYALPLLISKAKNFVPPNLRGLSLEKFLSMLRALTSTTVGPPLLGLIDPTTRSTLIRMAMSIIGQFGRFRAVSWLIKAGGSFFEPSELENLKKTREKIDADQLIKKVLIVQKSDHSFATHSNLAEKIRDLTAAVLVKPVASQLQQLFTAAKSIPKQDSRKYALRYLCAAMKFLPKNDRQELFSLIIKSGEEDSQQYGDMPSETTTLFIGLFENIKFLTTKEQKTLIDFINSCKNENNRIELLYYLVRSAICRDEELPVELVNGIKENKTSLNHYMLDMLEIKQRSETQRCILADALLVLRSPLTNAWMLDLLSCRMEYLRVRYHSAVFDAICSIPKLEQHKALLGLAVSARCLTQQNVDFLLNTIEKPAYQPIRQMIISVYMGAVSKNFTQPTTVADRLSRAATLARP